MTHFNEETRVEKRVLVTLTDRDDRWRIAEVQTDHLSHLTHQTSNLKWRYISAEKLQRHHSTVLVTSKVPCRQRIAAHHRRLSS